MKIFLIEADRYKFSCLKFFSEELNWDYAEKVQVKPVKDFRVNMRLKF